MMTEEMIKQFQDNLLEWYDHSARILPWRNNPSPYRVWISEIMLQQTRVETVKPYFERFINELSTIQTLGEVSDEKLLKLWEGLGYYSRAMNLKKAANIIMEKFHGEIPCDIEELKSLPGIGPYSSGAIASIAFGIRVPAIDGNVLRVMARVTENTGDITNGKIKREIEDEVNKILPTVRVGDFNQALMELGARICLPKSLLKCPECPIHSLCKGYQQGVAPDLPVKSKKKKRKIEKRTVFLIESEGRIALRQRPDRGLLSNLWEFPNVEGHLSNKECEEKMKEWGITPDKIMSMKSSKHIFTHVEWHMIGYYVLTQDIGENLEFTWATEEKIKQIYSIPSAFKAYQKFLDGKERSLL